MSQRAPGNTSVERAREIRVAGQLCQLRERFAERYEPEQWAAIERALAESALKADALRAVPLANGDEPEMGFAPLIAAGRRP